MQNTTATPALGFWFSYAVIRGQLRILDVTETASRGRRCFTAALSEDPRVAFTDASPASALARLVAHLEGRLAPVLRVTFAPTMREEAARLV